MNLLQMDYLKVLTILQETISYTWEDFEVYF